MVLPLMMAVLTVLAQPPGAVKQTELPPPGMAPSTVTPVAAPEGGKPVAEPPSRREPTPIAEEPAKAGTTNREEPRPAQEQVAPAPEPPAEKSGDSSGSRSGKRVAAFWVVLPEKT